MPERLFLRKFARSSFDSDIGKLFGDNPGYGKQMRPFKARTTEELMALLSAVATAILAVIIIATLYFGREIFVPIALAILLSFVLAPVVGILQRIRVPRGLAVVSVAILAFALIFAMGSLLATQLTQLARDLPRYQSTISEKIQSFRDTKAGRGTLERASDMLKDLGKEIDKPKDAASVRASNSIVSSNARRPFRWKYASLILVRWRAFGP
jgi:predicted PurR-regulated permease PerM